MVKCMARGDDGVVHVVFGLSRGNIDSLVAGSPIMIGEEDCQRIGLDRAQIFIFFGETELHMEKMLREQGLIGSNTQLTGEQT